FAMQGPGSSPDETPTAATATATAAPARTAPPAPAGATAPPATDMPPTAQATATALATGPSPTMPPPSTPARAAAEPTAGSVTPEAAPRQWAGGEGVTEDPALVALLQDAVADVDGQISLAVKDLGTGRGALLNPDLELPAASLFKTEVMYSVFKAG